MLVVKSEERWLRRRRGEEEGRGRGTRQALSPLPPPLTPDALSGQTRRPTQTLTSRYKRLHCDGNPPDMVTVEVDGHGVRVEVYEEVKNSGQSSQPCCFCSVCRADLRHGTACLPPHCSQAREPHPILRRP
eukprot:403861-Hanusia_phi.AAC.8